MVWENINRRLVTRIVNVMFDGNETDDIEKAKVRYSLTYIINELQKIILLSIVFLAAKRLLAFGVSLISLTCMRIYMGGFHRKTNLGCFLQSLLSFAFIVISSEIITLELTMIILVIGLVLITIILVAPVVSTIRASVRG